MYYMRGQYPHTKTNELPNLLSTAESVAINILKLEVVSITAIQQSKILEICSCVCSYSDITTYHKIDVDFYPEDFLLIFERTEGDS